MKKTMMPVKAMLLIGPTGAGKTPLGDYLEKNGLNGSRCFHFDFGNELRKIGTSGSPPEGFAKEEHSFIQDVLEKGLLLEDKHFPLAEKIIINFLERKDFRDKDLLVLNGLPRHAGQARDVNNIADIRNLLVLDCSSEEVCLRISGNTGGDRTVRDDDTIEMVRKKLEIFNERTSPLIDYYNKATCKIHRIAVTAASSTEDMYCEFQALVKQYAEI